MKIITRLAVTVSFLPMVIFSQKTATYQTQNKDFTDALKLYQNEQYQAALSKFQQLLHTNLDETTESDCAYYAANAAIRLNQQGADKMMEDFVEKYPTSTKRNTAFLEVAHYYFETGKYPYALKWYKKTSTGALTRSEQDKYNFNLGYSYYSTNNANAAKPLFQKVLNSPTYGPQAQYYLGYIAYEQDDYNQANQRFDEITDPRILEEKLGYYQADLNFKSGNFEEAILLAEKQMSKADRREQSELNKIIGESYFNLEKYEEAIPFLKEYKGKNGKWSNTDYYLLGYSYYKLGQYEEAISQFNKIIDEDNTVAQNAYYHLAECYLKTSKKSEALNAFRNAASMEYSEQIVQDALLNYARLSYEIGTPYETVPQAIDRYLRAYPKDKYEEELSTLLVNAYLEAEDYQGAMELLESNSKYGSSETYQKVTLFYGLELFNENKMSEAINVLDKSIAKAIDPNLKAEAQFWRAEAYYRSNNFEEALNGFRPLKESGLNSDISRSTLAYNLGYTYFKLQNYPQALNSFEQAAQRSDLDFASRQDALLRAGDGMFMTQNYSKALSTYQKVLGNGSLEEDYAAYQSAMCYGFMGNNERKIQALERFGESYAKSSLRDDALMELGNTLTNQDNNQEALKNYEKIIRDFPNSRFVPQAYLRRGLIFYNLGQNEASLRNFKTVVSKYSGTAEAKQAVNSAKLVYVDLGRVDEYAAWVESLDFVEVSDSELDDATFEVAQRRYLDGKTEAALLAYEDYLSKFPKGIHAQQAHFTLAQLYFSKDQKAQALPHYVAVAEDGTNEYGEQALSRVCEIYVANNDYANAVPFLERLEATAEIGQNRVFAQSNLMKGYYEKADYQNTLIYAEKVLAVPDLDDRIRSDAKIMISRAAYATGDKALAEKTYREVAQVAKGDVGAEATYYQAYFDHQKGAWEQSNTAVQKLVKDFAPYKKWGGKGLILMAKNYNELKDAFQATYILESVMENFSEFPEIVREARETLITIKQKESESNSSVNPEGF